MRGRNWDEQQCQKFHIKHNVDHVDHVDHVGGLLLTTEMSADVGAG